MGSATTTMEDIPADVSEDSGEMGLIVPTTMNVVSIYNKKVDGVGILRASVYVYVCIHVVCVVCVCVLFTFQGCPGQKIEIRIAYRDF